MSTAGQPDPEHPHRRFGVRALVSFVAAALFAVVTILVISSARPLLDLDHSSSVDLHRFALSHKGFTTAMRAISNSGTTIVWAVVLGLAAVWLLVRRLWRLALFVVVTGAGSSLLNNLIKLAVHRARPHLSDPVAIATGKSFPSGHSQAAIVGYGILLVVFLPVITRRARGWLVAVAALAVLLIGFSRIALGVHYLSDVIGAYLIGTVWLLGMISAFRAWRQDEGKPATDLDEGLEPESRGRLAP